MNINFFLDIFSEFSSSSAIIWNKRKYSYQLLIDSIAEQKTFIKSKKIKQGSVVALSGDFSPNSIAILFSLIMEKTIIVPFNNQILKNRKTLFDIAEVEHLINIDDFDNVTYENIGVKSENQFYKKIRSKDNPGLVLFSSGTSGDPKAAVHDFTRLLKKFEKRKKALRTLNFLLFDHWGGLNTMFHILSNGGTVITTKDRSPEKICKLIETHKIQLLPASPTFLNLLLISNVYKNYDLTSLVIISYGTEPMPKTTLKRMQRVFPNVKLLQTYGLIELGVMNSSSENNNSLWLKLGGDGYETRIVDGILQIKSSSTILGYLNAPMPLTKDGWFITGDQVLQRGEYIKILGRKSEIINVGGEKVYPQEVENIILQLNNIVEATVFSEKNSIIGNIVCAKVRLKNSEDEKEFISRLKKHCSAKLSKYKVPIKITIEDKKLHGDRYKKTRQ